MKNKKQQKIDYEKKYLIASYYKQGYPAYKLAELFHTTDDVIKRIARKFSIPIRYEKLSGEKKDEVAEKYNRGFREQAIAEEYGITPRAVLRIAKEYGIEIREPEEYSLDPKTKAKIVRLYKQGYSLDGISDSIGFIPQWILLDVLRKKGFRPSKYRYLKRKEYLKYLIKKTGQKPRF